MDRLKTTAIEMRSAALERKAALLSELQVVEDMIVQCDRLLGAASPASRTLERAASKVPTESSRHEKGRPRGAVAEAVRRALERLKQGTIVRLDDVKRMVVAGGYDATDPHLHTRVIQALSRDDLVKSVRRGEYEWLGSESTGLLAALDSLVTADDVPEGDNYE